MEKVPVTNNSKMPIYVGSEMIPPGETRHFDVADVPAHLRPAAAEPEAEAVVVDPVEELSGKSAKDIIAAIPGLSDPQLEQLNTLEQARETPRSTVLKAISEASLTRADLDGLSEKPEAEIIAAIAQLNEQQLEKLGDIEQTRSEPRTAVLSAISDAILQRAEAAK